MDKSSENKRGILIPSLAFAVVAFITGCGGVPDGYVGDSAGAGQRMDMANRQMVQGTAKVAQPASSSGPAINAGAIGSSFTVNSTANFKGFNSEIWNDRKSWYECNCGNARAELPKKMPWNPAG